jgi:hypothetical protein
MHIICSCNSSLNANRCQLYLLEGTVHMSSSGLREQHNRQLNICWREQYIYLHLDWENNTIDNWRHMYCSFQQIFDCLLCCSLNPDEDICTVPSNGYSIVYCVVLSIQMKIYVLFPPTDIQQYICLHLDWKNNTIDNWISVGRNSTYIFIWIEETTQ